MIAHSICLRGDPFGLHRREEAIHRRVALRWLSTDDVHRRNFGLLRPDIARPAHRAGDAIISHQSLELLTRILAALVRVMQQGVGLAASPDRHDQRIGDELRRHRIAHRPADDTA